MFAHRESPRTFCYTLKMHGLTDDELDAIERSNGVVHKPTLTTFGRVCAGVCLCIIAAQLTIAFMSLS